MLWKLELAERACSRVAHLQGEQHQHSMGHIVRAVVARFSKPAVDQGKAHPPKSSLEFRAHLAQGREYI
eukprot:scaffold10591_cov15-Prasinocladus_malaysianus.AAC.1